MSDVLTENHPVLTRFLRFYRYTTIYLCVMVTVIVILMLVDLCGGIPDHLTPDDARGIDGTGTTIERVHP